MRAIPILFRLIKKIEAITDYQDCESEVELDEVDGPTAIITFSTRLWGRDVAYSHAVSLIEVANLRPELLDALADEIAQRWLDGVQQLTREAQEAE